MAERLLIIADQHLGSRKDDIEIFKTFLENCDPENDKLIFLGDFFQVWSGCPKHWSENINAIMHSLQHFVDNGGESSLLVGNRDLLMPEVKKGQNSKLPFNEIIHDVLTFDWHGHKVLCHHGDLVNQQDKQYLRWRGFIRNCCIKSFLSILPAFIVRPLLLSGEAKMKTSNVRYKITFPKDEWIRFIDSKNNIGADYCFVGHFHPPEIIHDKSKTLNAYVVPDWMNDRSYLEIDKDMTIKHLHFEVD